MTAGRIGLTDLPDHLVILQNTPGDVHTVIVPVGPGHMFVDIGIDARHVDGGWQAESGSAHNETYIDDKKRRGREGRRAKRRRREGRIAMEGTDNSSCEAKNGGGLCQEGSRAIVRSQRLGREEGGKR